MRERRRRFILTDAVKMRGDDPMRPCVLAGASLLCALLLAQESPTKPGKEGQADEATLKRKVEELMERLGAEEWKTRESAQKELAGLGGRAGEFIWKHFKKTKDQEIRDRLKKVLEKIVFVPSELRRRLEPLFARLRGDDFQDVQDAAAQITRLSRSGGETADFVRRYARGFFGEKAPDLEFELKAHSPFLRDGCSYEAVLTVKNPSRSDAWIPIPWNLGVMVRTGNSSSSSSGSCIVIGKDFALPSWSTRNTVFPYRHLAPGGTLTLRLASNSGPAWASAAQPGAKVYITVGMYSGWQTSKGALQPPSVDCGRKRIEVTPLPPHFGRPPTGGALQFSADESVEAGGEAAIHLEATFSKAEDLAALKKPGGPRIRVVIVGEKSPPKYRNVEKVSITDNGLKVNTTVKAPEKPGRYYVYAVIVANPRRLSLYRTPVTWALPLEVRPAKKKPEEKPEEKPEKKPEEKPQQRPK